MKRYLIEWDDEIEKEFLVPYVPLCQWSVGDVLKFKTHGIDPLTNKEYEPVYRKIAMVRPTGYSWYYPEWDFGSATPGHSENHFMSENSNDPFLERWSLTNEADLV